MTRVSVILPVYNRPVQVCSAIASAQSQTHGDLEIVVVDDGSTDGTAEAVRRMAADDSRIRCIFQQNHGPAAARNKGIQLSTGEFLAFLDSDDRWLPEKTEIQLKAFQDAGMVYTSGWVENSNGERDEERTALLRPDGRCTAEEILFGHPRFLTPGVMIRRSCLDKTGLFDEHLRYYEDVDLWFRIVVSFRAHFVPDELVVIRKTAENTRDVNVELPELEPLECVCRMREKAVALYERSVRELTIAERWRALQAYRVQLVKEYLAQGDRQAARRAIRSGWDLRTWPKGPFFYLLSLVPGRLVPQLIAVHRRKLAEGKRLQLSL